MEENIKLSPEQAREIGKAYFFANDSDAEKRSAGLKLLLVKELRLKLLRKRLLEIKEVTK